MHLSVNTLLERVRVTPPETVEAEAAEQASERVFNPQIMRLLWSDAVHGNVAVINLYDASGRRKFLGRFDDGTWPVICLMDDLIKDVEEGRLKVLAFDPADSLLQRREEDINQRDRERRDRAYTAIAPMLNDIGLPALIDSKVCRTALSKAATKAKLTEKILRRYLRRFWQGGRNRNALLPLFSRCGAKGVPRSKPGGKKRGRRRDTDREGQEAAGVNLGPEDHKKFRLGLKAFYLKGEGKGRTLEHAFDMMLARHYYDGHQMVKGVLTPHLPAAEYLPSFGQFRAFYYKNRDISETLKHRYGPRRWNLRHRAVLGNSDNLGRYGPGSCYQIDSTVADVYLVSSLDPLRIIGRPILYLIVDVFSRLIVGFAVTLEAPSYTAAMLALENAATDKVEYCRTLGIEISEDEWPSAHLCNGLLADRGELASQFPDNLVHSLGIKMLQTAPYRPDWKAIVETRFKLANDGVIKWLPGAVHPRRERGDCDHSLDGTLTLRDFRETIVHFILGHNNKRLDGYKLDEFQIADQVEARPCELWQYGITHRSGSLHVHSKEALRLHLLPTTLGTVTSHGIEINNSRYTCPTAESENWFLRAKRRETTWKVDVSFHPHYRNLAFLRRGSDLEACTLIDNKDRFQRCDFEEVEDFFQRQKEITAGTLTADRQARVNNHAQVEAIKAAAQKRVEQARSAAGPQSKSARRSGLRAARAAEQEHERRQREEEFIGSSIPSSSEVPTDKIVTFPAPATDADATAYPPMNPVPPTPSPSGYVATASYLNMLKERRRLRQEPSSE